MAWRPGFRRPGSALEPDNLGRASSRCGIDRGDAGRNSSAVTSPAPPLSQTTSFFLRRAAALRGVHRFLGPRGDPLVSVALHAVHGAGRASRGRHFLRAVGLRHRLLDAAQGARPARLRAGAVVAALLGAAAGAGAHGAAANRRHGAPSGALRGDQAAGTIRCGTRWWRFFSSRSGFSTARRRPTRRSGRSATNSGTTRCLARRC